MKRFDLGMSLSYCPDWGVVESVREFFQNARDAEVVNPENKMYFGYDNDTQTLYIGNKDGNLTTNTLLLGMSNKRTNEDTIGKHGEGYKVATVVLTRLGKKVSIYNRKARETWRAKVIHSRRYQADVVVYDIEKDFIFKKLPNVDLVFEVQGITEDEYNNIVKSNLYLQDISEADYVKSTKGRVLTNKEQSGRLYVGGLFVTTSRRAKLGYDFEPSQVQLDRDRGFIDNLDLQFLCGKTLSETKNEKLIASAKDEWDGEYIRLFASRVRDDVKNICEAEYTQFKKEHGETAIPVTSTERFNKLKANGYNAVMVTDNKNYYIKNAPSYTEPSEDKLTANEYSMAADELEKWFKDYITSKNLESADMMNAYDNGFEIIKAAANKLREAGMRL